MDKIGRYEIKGKLGRGGFGHVFRAYDPEIRRPVAIKLLEKVDDPTMLERFRDEASVDLQHGNIIRAYDFGVSDGRPYLVMELLEGRSLDKVIADKALSLLDKVDILWQMAEG